MSQYAQAPDAVFDTINFTGGAPQARDLAPSIVFIICYALTVPLLVLRIARQQDRCLTLLRPTLFVLARLGMLSLRAYMAKQYPFYTVNELIAEIVLVSIGYIFLCDSLVSLWRRNVETAMPIKHTAPWVQQLARLLRLMLLASIITIIISSTSSSNSFQNNASGANTAIALRHASYCVSFAVTVVVMVATALTHYEFGLDARKSGYIFLPAVSLCIVGIYRVAQTFSPNPNDAIRGPVAFWVMQGLFEYVAYISFIAISIPTWYPAAPDDGRDNNAQLSMSQAPNGGYYANIRQRPSGLLKRLSSSLA